MKFLISLLTSVFICYITSSQQKGPNISFDKESFEFGKIIEAKGPVTHVYNFTNTGNEPLIIESVQPSCGCTTPEWSREPVVPGGKGYIKATFNPAGRPGPFNKSISIMSNGLQKMVTLKFSGEVVGKGPTVDDIFPFAIDNLRFSSTYISFGKLSPAKLSTRTLNIINTGTLPVTLSFPSMPFHLEVLVNPSTIKPNQKATIDFTFDPKKKNDWGFVSDAIDYTLNGKKNGKYRLNISASIEDDYSLATPQQLADAPKLILEKNIFEIGKVKAGTNVEVTYRFKNAGKSNLNLHKIVSTCGCTNVKAKESIIKPGGVGEITGVFNSTGQKGAVNKTITVITNDPKNLNLVLWIRGTVD